MNKQRQTLISFVGCEPLIPVFEVAKTLCTLYSAASVICRKLIYLQKQLHESNEFGIYLLCDNNNAAILSQYKQRPGRHSTSLTPTSHDPLPFCAFKQHWKVIKHNTYVRFEVFTAVTMKNGVFWVFTLCGSCKNPWCLLGCYAVWLL
jgi:hypothetical protein